MKIILFLFSILIALSSLNAQDTPQWMRYPAISPDGSTIAFSYKGDVYTVPSSGGTATLLTLHEAHDFRPVWSHDGSKIAFASDRYGNYDVFVIPKTGGVAERLTFFSSADLPSDFTRDNSAILFSSTRLDNANSQQFPTRAHPELYQVPITGGRVTQVLTTPALEARQSPDGNLLVFQDSKGYENKQRKHHTSSVTRDIWTYNMETKKYTQLSPFPGEDLDPVFSPDGTEVFYLSEVSGSMNVYRTGLGEMSKGQQVTDFKDHPVRHLSIADDGKLCYGFHGEIYTQIPGEEYVKLNVTIKVDSRYNTLETISVNGGLSEMAVSSNGKEVAFIKRGEVFVSSVKTGTTKRITNTPEQERNVSFSPDGRSLLYASERNESWSLYETSLTRDEEQYFFNSTVLKEISILETPEEAFQASYSPDGKEVAFLEERTALKVINLTSKAVREIVPAEKNYSYADGDQHYQWSPDGKWFLVNFLQDRQWVDQMGLISASGDGELLNLAPTGYGSYGPRWEMDGKMITWVSQRNGQKNHASWGGELDVYGMFLTQEAWDEYKLSEEEAELMADEKKSEEKDEDKNEDDKDKKDKKKDDKVDDAEPLKMDLDAREDRIVRLSVHSSDLSDAIVAKDGSTLYYLARFEKGYNLWQTNLRTKETKILAPLKSKKRGSLLMDDKGENLYVISNGSMSKVELKGGKISPIGIKGEMILNAAAERAYLAEHIWRQVKKKFYRVDLQGVNWDLYKEAYFSKISDVNNNRDFAELMSEMLGELNASHTGAYYWNRAPLGDQTASLGFFPDHSYTGNGIKIIEVMHKSPLLRNGSKIEAGVVIEKIDGVTITPEMNYYKLLNRKAGNNMLLSLFNPTTNNRWDETVKPITIRQENQLRYERWVKNCERIVEEASGGKIGYVHVRGMNDESYRVVYNSALGKNANKEGLVVDTRYNGGGWLHDDLATFLNGKKYMEFKPRDKELGDEPQFKWKKSSVVVMNESNYSDAHMFPVTYKAMGVGKLIGMPVAGTGTAVWWETLQNGVRFGIPEVGVIDNNGNYLENLQLEPDIKVPNQPGVVSMGRDEQLEAAVKELMK